MEIRHIIVEGCDGTGKTTLVKRLLEYSQQGNPNPHFILHERASTSIGGPVDNLAGWVNRDCHTIGSQSPSVYDRHPIISELIYGPICRGGVPGSFNDPTWVSTTRGMVAHHAMVIWCIPPWPVVRDNIAATEHGQMPGVVINARRIYDTYDVMSRTWPGVCYRYNYRTDVDKQRIIAHVDLLFGKK